MWDSDRLVYDCSDIAMSDIYVSWGKYPFQEQPGTDLQWIDQPLPVSGKFLPQGKARSYGDSCMLQGGHVLSTRFLRRFIAFDATTGVIRCEAGVQLADILDVVEPQGWFLAATPGTKYATVGGCIANDVHGKNHHLTGSFGHHLIQFELLRSDGQRLICSKVENSDWFNATIGGLGLTGVILWADIQLKTVTNSAINQETIKYSSLGEFFSLSNESHDSHEYTVAWVDCLASGNKLGRGHFIRGNHARVTQPKPFHSTKKLSMPIQPPISLVNNWSLRAFNTLYYHRQQVERKLETVNYDPFFYPLDGIYHWNRMYGPRGFLQYQCVVPPESSETAITEILQRIAKTGIGSFLAVLKVFGAKESLGLLSFPRPGTTLALDFPYQGHKTLQLFDQLDEVVVAAKGAIYPAKDAHIQAKHFTTYFPKVEQFLPFKDPRITSSFWQRVTESDL